MQNLFHRLVITLVATIAVVQADLRPPGMAVALSEEGMNSLLYSNLMPQIMSQYNDTKKINLHDPTLYFNDGQLRLFRIWFPNETMPYIHSSLKFNDDVNSMTMTIRNVTWRAQGQMRIQDPTAPGIITDDYLEFYLFNATFIVEMIPGVQYINFPYEQDELAPKLELSRFEIIPDPSINNTCVLGANSEPKYNKIFDPLVLKNWLPVMLKQATKYVEDTAFTQINKNWHLQEYFLKEFPWIFNTTLNLSQVRPQMIKNDTFVMALNGTFYNTMSPSPYVEAPTQFNETELGGKDMRFFITDYTLNSLFEVAFNTNTPMDLSHLSQEYLNKTITTDSFGTFFLPEIEKKYGHNKDVRVEILLKDKMSNTTISQDGAVSMSLNIELDLTIGTTKIMAAHIGEINFSIILSAKGDKIIGNLSKFDLGQNVTHLKTTLDITPEEFTMRLRTVLEAEASLISILLIGGIDLNNLIGLSNIDMQFQDGMMSVGGEFKGKSSPVETLEGNLFEVDHPCPIFPPKVQTAKDILESFSTSTPDMFLQ